jgi:two-component system sensor histidine kinase YesM
MKKEYNNNNNNNNSNSSKNSNNNNNNNSNNSNIEKNYFAANIYNKVKFPFLSKIFFGLRNKMFISFSIVIMFAVIFMSYFTVVRYSQTLQTNNIKYSNQVIGNLIRNLDDYINGLEGITNLAIYNHYIQTYLLAQRELPAGEKPSNGTSQGNDNSQSFEMSLELLGNFIYTRKDIASILLFKNDKLTLFKSTNLNIDTSFAFKNEPWYINTQKAGNTPVITGPHLQSYLFQNAETVFSVSRIIEGYDGRGSVGTILVDTNLKVVDELCNSAELIGNGYIFVIDDNSDVVFHPDNKNRITANPDKTRNNVYEDIMPLFGKSDAGSFTSIINNEKEQLVFKKMPRTNWTVVAVTPYKDMVADTRNIQVTVVIAGLICLIVLFALIQFLARRFTKPIISLTKMMNQADEGNLNIRSDIQTNDEISTLSHSFNNMLERIDSLMKEVVLEHELKRKSDLKVLQSQINPHFLYNTLDSIVWMIAGNNKNAIKMIEALSRFFRISLSKGQDLVTLSDELEHVRNYLIIQGMRYQNKILFDINVDESLINYMTLKIILQPLVENSIYHGIKNKDEEGHINISAEIVENDLIISVADDGVGMDEETCNDILKETFVQKHPSGSGIGVRNVNSRIKLYFGDEYGLSFKSELGVGTTVYIKLPLILE